MMKLLNMLLKFVSCKGGGLFYIGGTDVLPPPLKGLDEQNMLEAAEQGDELAKSRLIEHNLRLVVFIARRFENTGVNLEDLISIGTIGLIKAIGTYRRDKNIKPLYEERDFSQANLLDKLNSLYEAQEKKAREREAIYYRSRKGKPFNACLSNCRSTSSSSLPVTTFSSVPRISESNSSFPS